MILHSYVPSRNPGFLLKLYFCAVDYTSTLIQGIYNYICINIRYEKNLNGDFRIESDSKYY
jgi:hypothetical protein